MLLLDCARSCALRESCLLISFSSSPLSLQSVTRCSTPAWPIYNSLQLESTIVSKPYVVGMYLHYARLLVIFTLISAVLLSLLVGFLQIVLPSVAWLFPQFKTAFFDLGVYGAFRYNTYVSFNLTSPRFTTPFWDDQCDDGSYVLLTPKGGSVPHAGPVIVDTRGNLVWMSNKFNDSMNLNVQAFNGENYLTMWAGSKHGSQGRGIYHLLDSSYNIARSIHAVGEGFSADLHEFTLTKDGTALFTIYNTTRTDLSGIGRSSTSGWSEDSIFQEVDIATNELLFQWQASDHTDAGDTFMTNPFGGYIERWPFDVFHINSIHKDKNANYLISSRHFHAVLCISPEGETLGGSWAESRTSSKISVVAKH